MVPTLDLADATLIHKPFCHFAAADCLDEATADRLLRWFESEAPWRGYRDEFYDFDGVSLHNVQLPAELAFLVEQPMLDRLRQDLEAIFDTRLAPRVGVAGQCLRPGRDIGVHSDFGPHCQSHRIVLQLNRGWSFAQGGILMLLDTDQPTELTDDHCLYVPEHRSVVGFAISERSYHAVTRVVDGDRYSLCFSFSADA